MESTELTAVESFYLLDREGREVFNRRNALAAAFVDLSVRGYIEPVEDGFSTAAEDRFGLRGSEEQLVDAIEEGDEQGVVDAVTEPDYDAILCEHGLLRREETSLLSRVGLSSTGYTETEKYRGTLSTLDEHWYRLQDLDLEEFDAEDAVFASVFPSEEFGEAVKPVRDVAAGYERNDAPPERKYSAVGRGVAAVGAALLTVFSMGCSVITGPDDDWDDISVVGKERIEPRSEWREWHAEVVDCVSNRTGRSERELETDFDAIVWYEANSIYFSPGDRYIDGAWVPPHNIVLTNLDSERLIKHEMTHEILDGAGHDAPGFECVAETMEEADADITVEDNYGAIVIDYEGAN